jgi:hypothetical protein
MEFIMPARNDVTKDSLITKTPTDAYRKGWDRIFGGKKDAVESGLQEGLQSRVPETGCIKESKETKSKE